MSLNDTIIPDKYNPNPTKGVELIREYRKTKTKKTGAIKAGEILLFNYQAQTVERYDKNPIIISLRSSSKHLLAFNVNWLDVKSRDRLIRYLQRVKFHELTNRQKAQLTLRLRKLNFTQQAYRKYIKKHIRKSFKLNAVDLYMVLRHNLKNVVDK